MYSLFKDVVVRYLLEGYSMDVNKQNHHGLSPMHLAAIGGHISIIKLLLERSASCSTRSVTGSTPLHAAASNGRHDVCALLFEDCLHECSFDAEDEEGAVS